MKISIREIFPNYGIIIRTVMIAPLKREPKARAHAPTVEMYYQITGRFTMFYHVHVTLLCTLFVRRYRYTQFDTLPPLYTLATSMVLRGHV